MNRSTPRAGAVLAAGLALAAAAPAGWAQDGAAGQNQINATMSGWTPSCTSAGREAAPECTLAQRAVLGNGQTLVAITIRVPAETLQPVILIQAPLGLDLQKGLSYRVDTGAETLLPFQTCEANGCFAGSVAPPALIDSFRRGGTLTLTIVSNNGQTIAIPVPLAGFTAAYSAVD